MQFIDSHLHLQDYKAKDAQQIIADLRAAGFAKVVCASTSPADWEQTAAFAAAAPDLVIPAFGLHPWYIAAASADWPQQLAAMLQRFPKAWVGECGLDRLKAPSWQGQEEAFAVQCRLAGEFDRPLNIHALKAEDRLARFWPDMPPRFMLHSFGGSLQFLHEALKHGAYISLSPSFLKRGNHSELFRAIPDDRLLLESDAPFLSDYRDIPDFAAALAALGNTDAAALIERVNRNFREFCHGK